MRKIAQSGHPASGLPDGLFSNQKSRIWVIFGGPLNVKCWYILCSFGKFFDHLVKFMAVWYSCGHL
jgi:hypothetical protein